MFRVSLKKILFFTSLVGIGAVSLLALADFTTVLETPQITSGTVVNDTYFYGPINVGTSFEDSLGALNKNAFYTLNACGSTNSCPAGNACSTAGTWQTADIDNSVTDILQISETEPTYPPKIATFLNSAASPEFAVTWGDSWRVMDGSGAPLTAELSQPAQDISAFHDPGENLVMAWVGNRNQASIMGSGGQFGGNIHAQIMRPDGTATRSAFGVDTQSNGYQSPPSIATFQDDSGFVIVWQSRVGEVGFGNIYGRIYDESGNPLTSQFRVNSYTPSTQIHPAVTTFNDDFIVLWQSSGQDGSGFGIYGQIFNVNGSTVGGEFRVNQYTTADQIAPVVSSFPDGSGFVAVWESAGQDGSGNGIYARIFDNNGSPEGDEFRVNTITAGDQLSPSIAMFPDNSGFFISWELGEANPNEGIYIRAFNREGTPVGNEVRIDEVSSSSGDHAPAVAVFPDDSGLAVVWLSNRSPPNQDQISGRVFFKQVDLTESNVPHGNNDIALQFKIVDADTDQAWCSPVRHYRYADPNEGSGGSISYADGYTVQSTAIIGATLPTIRNGYQSLQLYQKTAPLNNGTCGSFSGWNAVGSQTTLATQETVSLSDATCYQFKWTVTNILGYSFDYTNSNTLKVDRQPPVISFTDDITGGQLHLHLTLSDTASGIASRTYKLNSGSAVSFTQDQEGDLVIPLIDGANRIELFVTDHAGNTSSRQFFRTADLTAPAILIHSIREGETYGTDIPLIYSTTKPLSGMAMNLDNQASAIPVALTSLENGAHTLILFGTSLDGTVISTTVHFNVQERIFNLTLLSPQNRDYEDNTTTVQYLSTKPVNRAWLNLDGGADSEEMNLTGLTDGAHDLTLHAESVDGETNSVSTHFTVHKVLPALSITGPENGAVLPSRTVPISFESRDTVTYEVGELSGSLLSGEPIELPADGVYTLTLTATHSSGNYIRQSVTFEVDTTELEIDIVSPHSNLYAASEIPIEYTSNTVLSDLEMTLDGNPVTVLQNLGEGLHTFRLTARDRAGGSVSKAVTFTVQRLEIVSPSNQQQVVVENYPPLLPVIYDASNGFNAITMAQDQEAQQLIVAAPKETTLLQTSPGWHDLTLRGRLNEFNLARQTRFKVGIKNITAGKDSIHYTGRDCSDELSCLAEVTLRIRNTGDLDVTDEPVVVKFDHLKPDGTYGSPSQLIEIGALNQRELKTIRLDPFRATSGDQFFVTIDPEGKLVGEKRNDNMHSVLFEGAKIMDVTPLFPDSNVYLSGVSFFNSLHVSAAGPIETVKFVVPGERTFIDDQADNGWNSIVDMGLLSPDNNCVQIVAYGNRNEVLDSRPHCFNVKKMDIPDSGHSFPWGTLASSGTDGEVIMGNITRGALAIAEINAVKKTLRDRSMAIIPKIREEGKVTYTLFTKTSQIPLQQVRQGTQLGGAWTLPVSHAMFVTHLDFADGTCETMAAKVFEGTRLDAGLTEFFQGYIDEILKQTHDAVSDGTEKFNISIEQFLEDKIPGVFGMTDLFNNNTFLFGGVLSSWGGDINMGPLGAYYTGIVHTSGPPPTVNITPHQGEIIPNFQPGKCGLKFHPLMPNLPIVNTTGSHFSLRTVGSDITIEISGQRTSAFGFGAASLFDVPILPFFGTASAEFHPQTVVIPIRMGLDYHFDIKNNMPTFDPPPFAWMRMQKTYGPVTLVEGEALVHFIVFGYGKGIKIKWLMDILGMSDTRIELVDPVTQIPLSEEEVARRALENTREYSKSLNEFKIFKRNRYCALWFCWWGDWGLDDTQPTCEEKGEWYETPAYAPQSHPRPDSCPLDGG